MKRTSALHGMAASGLRALLIACFAMLVLVTIWICLVAGLVVVLRPALGSGGALLAVAGGLVAASLLFIAVVVLARREPPAPPPSGLKAEAVTLAFRVLQAPTGRRLTLGAAGLLLLALAIFMSGTSQEPPE